MRYMMSLCFLFLNRWYYFQLTSTSSGEFQLTIYNLDSCHGLVCAYATRLSSLKKTKSKDIQIHDDNSWKKFQTTGRSNFRNISATYKSFYVMHSFYVLFLH